MKANEEKENITMIIESEGTQATESGA